MDRKEAIEYWEEFLEEIPEIEGMPQEEKDKQEQATLMAIAALQEPEIVRCKDCKHWDKEIMYCNHTGMQIEPDGYCVYGERKE